MSVVKTNAAQIGQSLTATNNFTLYQPASPDGTVRLGVGNAGSVTDILTLNSSSKVGVGTSTPSTKFEVAGGTTFDAATIGSLPAIMGSGQYGGGFVFKDTNYAGVYTSSAGTNLEFFTGMDLASTATSKVKMLIDGSGNVGINTRAPAYKLDIQDQVNAPFRILESGDADGVVLRLFRTKGTLASPTGLVSGDVIASMRGFGYTSAGAYTGAVTNISMNAAETFTATANGTYITLATTAIGSTTGTERMRIDSAGNIGIGVTPAAWAAGSPALQIVNASLATSSANPTGMWLQSNAYSDGTNYRAIVTGAGAVYRQNGGIHFWQSAASVSAGAIQTMTEYMRLDASGKLGLGVAGPVTKLQVNSSGAANTEWCWFNTNCGSGTPSASIVSGISLGGNYSAGGSEGNIIYGTYLTFAKWNGTTYTENMRVSTNGNLSIGTTSEANTNTRLYAYTTAQSDDSGIIQAHLGGTGSASVIVKNNYGWSQLMQWVNNGLRIGSRSTSTGGSGNVYYTYGNDSVGMCVDGSNGQLLVGRATVSYVNSVNSNTFYTNAASPTLHVVGDYNGNVSPLRIQRYASDGDGITFFYGNTQKGYVSVTSTGTTYNTLSDYRLKENVKPMTGALDKVMDLNPVTYDWIGIGKAGQGFIAHELQSVVPECVTGEKDAIDDNGDPRYQGVDTSFLVATLAKAIQELNAKVEAQAAEIAKLKGA